MPDYLIAPSILSADFARLGEDVSAVLDAGADVIHFDVMDNHFVPNLTVGPMVCKALRDYGVSAPIDVHLMIEPVDALIPPFAKAGADIITFHPEASDDIGATIALIKANGCKAGLVLNPLTPLEAAMPFIQDIDVLLLMSVNPGFGGQSFIPQTLDKIRQARALFDKHGLTIKLEVDGGINLDNIADVAAAGADMFVAGSAIFASKDYHATITQMRSKLAQLETI
ncbi:ribulose-phosphate 3-epimerase [Thalassotalea litorea]|uniref:ribulose-phosphate 3-epimerase n=1 Tax=Thalassotalea litorea TaxID=2020715 RepID=UPI0037352E53